MVSASLFVAADACHPVRFDQLDNWQNDNHGEALQAFLQSSNALANNPLNFEKQPSLAGKPEDWSEILVAAQSLWAKNHPKEFFETKFAAVRLADAQRPEGLFTGYYEPLVQGSRTQSKTYEVPVYAKPSDLIAASETEHIKCGLGYGRRTAKGFVAYDTRMAIEQGSLNGQGLEICWLNDWADAFFMHIQGSGRVLLEDGRTIRLSYAAKSGQPYQAIGAVLVDRGILTHQTMSMQSLRSWMKANASEARALMWQNPSYIFFREIKVGNSNLGAIGAGKVHLTPYRSLAVDSSHFLYGTPLWLKTTTPREVQGGEHLFERLMIAQDTGTAIRGRVRGDVYCGWGEEAALFAGHMKSTGRLTALLPVPVAKRLGLAP